MTSYRNISFAIMMAIIGPASKTFFITVVISTYMLFPTIIYVKNFINDEITVSDFPKKEVKTPIKGKSGVANLGSLESYKKDTNNTNINNTDTLNEKLNPYFDN